MRGNYRVFSYTSSNTGSARETFQGRIKKEHLLNKLDAQRQN